jgi:hypothetical protein
LTGPPEAHDHEEGKTNSPQHPLLDK